MTKNNDRLKIILFPFLAIIVVLVLLIGSGFAYDKIRTQNRLEKLKSHAGAIYQSHQKELIPLLSTDIDKNPSTLSALLERINLPEAGLYRVSLLRHETDGWFVYTDGDYYRGCSGTCSSRLSLSSLTAEKVAVLTNIKEPVATQTDIFSQLLEYESPILVATIPIENANDKEDTSFLLVRQSKSRDF